MHRRNFLRAGTAAVTAGLLRGAAEERLAAQENAAPKGTPSPLERICLFTDHVDDHGYSYADVAKMLARLKIAGPDLTVRSGGLVKPEQVAEELPKAAAAFREAGLSIPMISTNVTSADDPTARAILTAMGQLGIRYYKLGYYHYDDPSRWQEQLETTRRQLSGLIELGRAAGVQAGLHNHAGESVGAAFWDAWEMLAPLDPAAVGFYYDPAHATLEGAKFAWRLNFLRIAPRLKMIALKDFVWEKKNGQWSTHWVPLGEGMVAWPEFFRLLASTSFAGPISLHIEYDPGGNTPLERFDNAYAAAERDLAFVRRHLAA